MIIVGGCCYSNLSVKFLLWVVYVPGYSVDYIIQGCEAIVKMTQLRLRLQSCWFS